MNRISRLSCLTAILIGCSDATNPTSDRPVTDQSNEVRIPPPPEFDIPTRSEETRPTTREEFAEEFVRRFDNDCYDAFIQLGYWEGTTPENRAMYMKNIKGQCYWLLDGTPAELRGDVEFLDFKSYDAAYSPKNGDESIEIYPHPTDIFKVTSHFGDSRKSVIGYYAVGRHNGRLYFCTIK